MLADLDCAVVGPTAPFRVIGSTRNVDAWYDTFGVQAGDKYYLPPDQRVRLW
jgi:putative endopeptidase